MKIKGITVYTMYHPKRKITIECTEKYVNSWKARGFILKDARKNEDKNI